MPRAKVYVHPVALASVHREYHNPDFCEGNKLALATAMPPEKHGKRLAALVRGWNTLKRKRNGEKIVSVKEKRKVYRRTKHRLRETVAKEAHEINEIARKNAYAAMKRLAEIATDPNTQDNVAIQAIETLLSRGYGKPNQTNINATVDVNGKVKEISKSQLDERISKALERIESLTGGEPKPPKRQKQSLDLRELDRDPGSSRLN